MTDILEKLGEMKLLNLLHVRRVFGCQDVIDENPRHGHLDGELDPLAHCHLKVELAVPKLREVTTFLQTPWK